MNARKNNDRCDQKAWQTFYASKNILSRVCDRVNVIHPILFSKNFITFFALRCLLSRFFTLFLYSPHLPENIFITSFSPPQTKNLFHRQINCGFSWNKIKKKNEEECQPPWHSIYLYLNVLRKTTALGSSWVWNHFNLYRILISGCHRLVK